MNEVIKVSIKTAIELSQHGVECYSMYCYYPKKDSVLTRADIKQEGLYYPALTLEECLNFLYSQNYAVCIQFQFRSAWAEDEFNHIPFTTDLEDYPTLNEADLVANLIIRMIRNKLMTTDIINRWLDLNTKKWLQDEKENVL